MTLSCHQPQYLPYLGFFHKLARSDVFVALDDVQFQKNGVQNRNKIKTGQGWQWLTVPVLHRSGQEIREVRVNPDVPWPRKHLNALATSYSRAPFYARYAQELRDIIERQWDSLCALNMELVRWAMAALGLATRVIISSTLGTVGTGTERLVNICRAAGADRYLSGPGGAAYLDPGLFQSRGIELLWQQFVPPTYAQVFPQAGFLPNLSVVDVLFACGPDARRFLE